MILLDAIGGCITDRCRAQRGERGFFARTWCRQELAARGLDTEIAQESVSYNDSRNSARPPLPANAPRGK